MSQYFGVFAIVCFVFTWQGWRQETSLRGRLIMVALTTFSVLLGLTLFLDAIRRPAGSIGAAIPILAAILALLLACGISGYATAKMADHPLAHGRPVRAGIFLGLITFAVFSVGFIPFDMLVVFNHTSLMVAIYFAEAFSLAMAGIVGWAVGWQPGLRT